MKTFTLLNAGVGDYYGNPVLYSNTNRNRYIVIRKDLHGCILYYAYKPSFAGSFVTLKGAIRQMLIGDKLNGKYFASRYWEDKEFKRRRDAVKFASKLIREYYDSVKPCTSYK